MAEGVLSPTLNVLSSSNLIQDGGGNVEFDAKFTVTLNLIQGLFCLVKKQSTWIDPE